MSDIANLIDRVRQEAERLPFPIDTPVYQAAGKVPTQPILYAGNLKSQICFFGRDLGRDEVRAGQPLIGAAGTMVREGFYWALHREKSKNRQELQSICDRVLLANTVPYKPPGNKAYEVAVKERFRPFIEKLLTLYWQGNQIITLGTEAFKWFAPYGRKGEVESFFRRSDRFSSQLEVVMEAIGCDGKSRHKKLILLPLPHPSPLNQRYYAQFPRMLQDRLNEFEF
jgi:uracil-DNA glycosylase